jgi:hypothetical protein
MTQADILKELEKLAVPDRLAVIETALQSIRHDLRYQTQQADAPGRQRQLAAAAQALLPDYASDDELTAFTALDGEDIHA